MTVSILLLVGMVVCFAAGISLLLERSLTRMVLGFLLVGNATNLLIFFMSGSYGAAPLYDSDLEASDYSDPLPQAFILTAIVITFGVTAFLLALVYRSWRLAQVDTVEDDVEDIAMRTLDPTKDDEPFDEVDAGDTEFGSSAEAAVSTAVRDPDDIETMLDDYTDEHEADRDAVDEWQDESEERPDEDAESGARSLEDLAKRTEDLAKRTEDLAERTESTAERTEGTAERADDDDEGGRS